MLLNELQRQHQVLQTQQQALQSQQQELAETPRSRGPGPLEGRPRRHGGVGQYQHGPFPLG